MNRHTKTSRHGHGRERAWLAIFALTASVSLTSLFSSCINDKYEETATVSTTDTYLSLNVQTAAPNRVRAYSIADTNPGNPTTESSIHSIHVWAFNSGDTDSNALPVGYREETLNTPVDGENNVKTVSMKIPRKSGYQTLENLDLYILANAESEPGLFDGIVSKKSISRSQLESLTLKNQFGITSDSKAQCTEVPAEGLPVSRVITGISVSEHVAETEAEAATKAITIPLIRAVSKLHFFFARKKDAATDQASITRIELDEQVLPTTSRIFPVATTEGNTENAGLTGYFGSDTQYNDSQMVMDGVETACINEVEDPTTLIRQSSETASTYMKRLYAATVECNRSYLRESDKPLTGKIYYKLNASAAEKSVDFTIPADGSAACRNSELVVYGYFLDGGMTELTLKYYVAEWNEKTETDIKFD